LQITGAVILAYNPLAEAQTQRPAKIVVGDAQTCGTCRLQRTSIVAVRDTEHLLLPNAASLLVDGRGQVYAQDMQTKQFLVFDPRGKWIGRVGGVGSGPGEFKSAISAKIDQFDSLWVSAPGQRRVSIFAPSSRAYVRDVLVEAQIGPNSGDWLLLDRGQAIVSLPYAPKPEDRLIQLGADGRVVKKLGPEAEVRVRSATLAPARDGKHFWRVRVTSSAYVIEKWTNAGTLLQVLERAAKWWAQPFGDDPPTRRPGGGDIHVESVREDTSGKLWVMMRLPRQTYWENRPRAQTVKERSKSEMQTLPRVPAFYRLLDVLDASTGKLVYSDSAQASLYAVVTPDIILCGSSEDDNGFPIWSLCRVTLVK